SCTTSTRPGPTWPSSKTASPPPWARPVRSQPGRDPGDRGRLRHPRRRRGPVRLPALCRADTGRPCHLPQRVRPGGDGGHRHPCRPHRRRRLSPHARGGGARRADRDGHDRPVHRRSAPMIGELLTVVGATLILLSAIGVVRFSDPLARLHALAKASTLGVLVVLAGAAANLRDLNDITSVVLAAVLHLLASPPASNMLSRATYLAADAAAGPVDEWRHRRRPS